VGLQAIPDAITKGQPIFAVETDKLADDVEATVSGVVLKIVVGEGEDADVMAPCCYVGEPGEVLKLDAPAAAAPAGAEPEPQPAEEVRAAATPAAKRLARELGVDLRTVRGTGPSGRIQEADVRAAKAAGAGPAPDAPQPAEACTVKPLSEMRRTIARRLLESKRTIPHVYFEDEVDATAMIRARRLFEAAALERNGRKLSFNDLVLKAVAAALTEFPEINARTDGETVTTFRHVNIGMAVAVDRGLIVPVIRSAEEKSVAEISKEAAELAQRARSGKLGMDEYTGGTFSVSNLGSFGLESFHAIINPPEVGILAVGSIKEKVVAVEHQPAVRPMMRIAGSFDHRLVDGAVAARFMLRVKELLENAPVLFF